MQQAWTGEFEEADWERKFRVGNLNYAKRMNYIVAVPVVLACVMFLANDVDMDGIIWPVALPRVVLALLVLGLCVLNYRGHSWQSVYWVTSIMATAVIVTVLWIDYQRPANFLTHLGVDVIVIVGIFITVPTIRAQSVLASIMVIGLLLLHFLHKQVDFELSHVTVPLSLLLAVVLGASVSVAHNRTRRLLFAQLETERGMREELLQTQSKVDELSKLVPMCASCKNIRNDDGYWERVETYVQAMSGSIVSHGICPDCAAKLYPELKDHDH